MASKGTCVLSRIRVVGLTGLTGLGLLLAGNAAGAAPHQTLHGQIPRAVTEAHLAPVGRLADDTLMHLAIGLPLRQQAQLGKLLQELYDPASPNYRHYLTPAQFTEQFGPTKADYQGVIAFAKAHGLRVTGTHLNRVVLEVEGTAADVEKALHVTLRVYRHPKEARTFYAPDTEPSLDLGVSILHIAGLDNFALPHPSNLHVGPAAQPVQVTPSAGSLGGQYIGNDFRAAYVPGTTLNGAGQSVALVQYDGYYASDITRYASLANLAPVPLTNVLINGGPVTPGSGNGEVCLDIEMVMAMAPAISKIIVYEGTNGVTAWSTILNQIADDNLARQVSCSWSGGSPDPTSEGIFQQMSAQGQSFFNASGDSDAAISAFSFPCDSTNITEVGGTQLFTSGPGGSWTSETVWNWGIEYGTNEDGVGSSGGISTYYAIPPWQQGISMTANLGSTTQRNVPDVALTGDHVFVAYGNGLTNWFGGTSCAAPLWAGLTALINQQAAINGLNPVGFLNPALYTIGKGANYTNCFHDITTSNNTWSKSTNEYYAVTGYDLCTGWGTPTGTNLIYALAGTPLNAPSIATAGAALAAESCLPTNGAIDPGETVTVNFSLVNTGTANASNVVATLLATGGVTAPSGAQSYGLLGTNSNVVTQPFSLTATGACGGTLTATLQIQNGTNQLGTVAYNFSLGATTVNLTQNFDSVTAPALPAGWTTTAGGGESVWKTSTSTADTAPNAAFSPDATTVGSNTLVSPVIAIPYAGTQLTFRNNYNLHYSSTYGAYGAGVLEISIGGGAFQDIVTAGGSFVGGGYNTTVSTHRSNPLPNGRPCWGNSSGGFITTTVNLPVSAVGQNIQLRWLCASSTSSPAGSGWYVDSVAVTASTCCTGGSSAPVLTVSPVSFNFGTLVTGQSSNTQFNVINSGSGALTGSVTTISPFSVADGSPYSVNAGQTGTVTVSFAPASGGTFNANVAFAGNGGVSTSTVTGVAITPAVLGVSPASYAFGTLATGAAAQTTFVVTNSGGATLSGTASVGLPFSLLSGSPFSVAGFSSSNVVVRFSPTAPASYASNVIFTTTAGNSTNPVTGTGAIIPAASFTAANVTGTAPLVVTFTDTSAGTITSRAWNFGDNTTSNTTLTSLTHSYTAGVYTVRLVVTGPVGVSTNTQNNLVLAQTPAQLSVSPASYNFGTLATGATAQTTFVVTNAGGSTLTGTASVSLPFSILSGSAYTVAGFSSSNVVVQFNPSGVTSYATNLIFYSNGGDVTNPVSGTGALVPLASFSALSATGGAPLLVSFTDSSAGTITNRTWTFGDNTSSNTTLTSMTHSYTAGTYSVALVVTGPLGVSTNTQNNLVLAQTPPLLIVTPGSFDFGVLATGTTAQTTFTVTNAGQATLTGTATAGGAFTVTVANAYSLAGNQATNVVISFTPVTVGDFATNVIFASNGGAVTNPVSGSGALAVLASFTATPTNGITPLPVAFTDTSTGTITNRFWNFGDGATSNTLLTALTHTYLAPATNTVTLTVAGPLGTNFVTQLIVTRPADSVGDGIPDAWRQQYFGGDGSTTNAQSCAACDPDGDGFSNYQEYLAGTDPMNSLSALRVTLVGVDGVNVILDFSSVAGKLYDFEWSGTPDGLNPTILSNNIPGTGGVIELDDAGGATNSPRFYRVRLLP